MWLRNIKESDQCLYVGYMMAIAIIFYILNVCTPHYMDDWNYCFKFGTTEPIQNFCDVLESQYTHYFEMNGRCVAHTVVQTFDGIIGKGWFNVFNTLVFVCFVHLLCVAVLGRASKQYFLTAVLATFAVFWIFPGFRNCFLWMSGACNYLWSATLLLLFHELLRKERCNKYCWPICVLYGILCGWTHEGIVLGLAAGYLFYYLIHRDELAKSPHKICLLAGLCIGIILLVLSPGSIQRAIGNGRMMLSVSDTIRSYLSAFVAMGNVRLLPLLLAVLLLLSYSRRIKPDFWKNNLIWVVAITVNFLFILFTKHDSEHSRFGIELFAMILLLKVVASFCIKKCHVGVLAVALIAYMLIFALPVCWRQKEMNESVFQSITSSNDSIFYYQHVTNPQNRFIVPFPSDGNAFQYDRWENKVMADFYGREKLILLPVSVQTYIKEPSRNHGIPAGQSLPFYILPFEGSPTNVLYRLEQIDYASLPFYIRPLAPRLARYAASEMKAPIHAVVNIDGTEYLLIGKNSMIDNRVKEIVVQTDEQERIFKL